ncbi:MAG: hypothetical protein AB1756_00460 [Acidobacteriota bacterium]
MAQKESMAVVDERLQTVTAEDLMRQIMRIVEETVRDCSNGQCVTVDYLGQSLEAHELDLRKFILKISGYVTLN